MNQENYSNVAHFYDSVASAYANRVTEEAHSPFPVVIPQILEAHAVVQPECDVLDLACGAGLLKTFTDFRGYTGADISEAMLNEASEQGYDMLIHDDVQTVLAGLPEESVDGVLLISAAYFLSPHVLSEVVIEMRRVAKKFILFTFDGITEALKEEYAAGGMSTYNHIGFPLPNGIERFIGKGWRASTREDVPVEYCFGLLP